jgi:DNA-binding PadR family transcriptional regulator
MAERNKNAVAVALGGLRWLKGKSVARGGRQARRDYRLTAQEQNVLKLMREQTRELFEEVVEGERKGGKA